MYETTELLETTELVETTEPFQLPTVQELLSLPEVVAGEPEIVATQSALAAPVRWAHVIAGTSASGLLDGHELVLTTGAGWPEDDRAVATFINDLCDADISAVALELGTHFDEAPQIVRDVLKQRDVALIILHREVRFVQITQRIHRRILGAQNEALQAREHVHRFFTELGLNRSPADFMVEQMAITIGSAVVLENTSGQVIAWSSPESGADPAVVLEPWTRGTFVAPGTPPLDGEEQFTRVAVEAQGTRWGTLTALSGPSHPAGRHTVLELGAIALALGRLADGENDEWIRLSSKKLFDTLLGGRYRTDTDLATQLTASGLPVNERELFGVALTGIGDFGSHITLERAVLETALRRAIAPEGRAVIASNTLNHPEGNARVSFLALISLPPDDVRGESSSLLSDVPGLAIRLARELEMLVPSTSPASWRAHLSLGVRAGHGPGRGVRGLLASIEGVIAAGVLTPSSHIGRVSVQEAARQPLTYLLREFSGSPAIQEYVITVLGPLLEHDRVKGPGHTGDLIRVLEAYLHHPNNRSLAATRASLSRSVFYQRLDLITELLGVDLADGETITTLSVALLAHGINS